jgi:peptide/nickel transport system substrate-binding protein
MKRKIILTVSILLASVLLVFPLITKRVEAEQDSSRFQQFLWPADANYNGTLVLAEPYEPPDMQTATSTLSATHSLGGQLYDPLIYMSIDLKTYLPGLAQSWEISDDAKTYTFHLVQNATWHDGVPFTSADVKFTMEVWKQYHSRIKKVLTPLDRIETPDNYTVRVVFTKSWTPFMAALTEGHISTAKHLYEGTDILNNPYNRNPIGTGPFRFKEWVSGDHITLEKNKDYWRQGQPYVDKVIYRYIPDEVARVSAFETGEVHILTANSQMDPTSLRVLGGLPNVTLAYEGTFRLLPVPLPLIYNLRNPLVNNVKVRQAIAWAIDRDAMIESIYRGLAARMDGFFTNSSPWYNPNVEKYYPRNADKANQLLDAAGYPKNANGTRFTLVYVYDHSLDIEKKPAEIVISNLRDVGIEIIEGGGESVPTWERIFLQHDFDLGSVRYGAGPDPYIGIGRMYLSTNIGNALFNNGAGYNNSEVDTLWNNIASTVNETKRREYYWDLLELTQEELPYFWLIDGSAATQLVYHNDKLGNVNTWADNLDQSYHTIYFVEEAAITTQYATDWALTAGIGASCLVVGVVAGFFTGRIRYRGKTTVK